ncbi:MAG: glutathione S-transferase family protein [Hyphomicrobiales bacterium]
MSITVYDLCGADEGLRFSPTCWRTKLALSHKKLAFDAVATPFTKIKEVVSGEAKTVPTIVDGGEQINDSFKIALYLDEKYPDAPSLFGGEQGVAAAQFVQNWTNSQLGPLIASLVIKDIHDVLAEPDQKYFRESREKMIGKTLEEVQAGREDRVENFRTALAPLRMTVGAQNFIGGDSPVYADYIVFGTVKWLMQIAQFEVLAGDDPVKAWFERIDAMYSGV